MKDYSKLVLLLLSKAKSSGTTKEEREAFLRKALELQVRYDVDIAQHEEEKETFSRGDFIIKSRTWGHENSASLLRAFFNVKVVTLFREKPIKVAILGRRSSVIAAKAIYDFLVREFDKAWLEASWKQSDKKAFYRGLYLSQREKLKSIKEYPAQIFVGTTEESRCICLGRELAIYVKSENQELEDYLLREFPNAKGGKGRTSKGLDRDSIKKGKEAGAKINVHRSLRGKNKYLTMLDDK